MRARETYVRSGKLPLDVAIRKGLRSMLVDPWMLPVRYLPGPIGMKLRQVAYRAMLGSMGTGCVLDVGVSIVIPANVHLSDFVYLDQYIQLVAPEGHIRIGRRCHIAQFSVITGHAGVEIGDYVAIASGAKLYSLSEWPGNGKRICGPMIPQGQRGLKSGPICIEKDAFVGANAVIMPGVTIGEGAVVGANTIVHRDVKPWTVVVGFPPKIVGRRQPVTVEDV
jgi:acetyltransferase-like isoleucine patch superfamily enzyme